MANDESRQLVTELLHAARVLAEAGCLPASDGNFSARIDRDRILLTARGIEKRELRERDMVEVSLEDEHPASGSTEWAMHRTLYRSRPNVNCVLHVHSPGLTAFAAVHRVPRIELLAEAYVTVGAIALVPFVIPGTPLVGESLLKTNATAMVYLLSNHGAVAVGTTVRETLHRLERAEFLAQVELNSVVLGSSRPLTPEEVSRLDSSFR